MNYSNSFQSARWISNRGYYGRQRCRIYTVEITVVRPEIDPTAPSTVRPELNKVLYYSELLVPRDFWKQFVCDPWIKILRHDGIASLDTNPHASVLYYKNQRRYVI